MGGRCLDIDDHAMGRVDEVIGRVSKEGRRPRGSGQPGLRVGQGKGAGGRLLRRRRVQPGQSIGLPGPTA